MLLPLPFVVLSSVIVLYTVNVFLLWFNTTVLESYQPQSNQIILECKVSGNPTPKIFWQKDNTLLSLTGKKYKYVEPNQDVKQLIIENPLKEDTGIYTCYAENSSGQTKLSKFLNVIDYTQVQIEKKALHRPMQVRQEEVITRPKRWVNFAKTKSRQLSKPLRLEKPLKHMNMMCGNRAQLSCKVSGIIEEVYWMRNHERITKDMRHKVYNINGILSLEIYGAKTQDSAQYRCVIKNNQISIESTCQLNVFEELSDSVLNESFLSPITGKINY